MDNVLDINELVTGLAVSGLDVVVVDGVREETLAQKHADAVPVPSQDVLCWSGLTVANVKAEFPNLDDQLIHDFIKDHEEVICEEMSNAAMDYVINNIGEYRHGK